MNLNKIVKIHKENKELGFSSNLPVFILEIWYMWHLYWQKDFILFIRYFPDEKGFLLFDLIKSEIVVIAVEKGFHNKGLGTSLISMLPKQKIIVIHEEGTQLFYEKNGFKKHYRVNEKQILSIK